MKRRFLFYGVTAILLMAVAAAALEIIQTPTRREVFAVTVTTVPLVKTGNPIPTHIEITNLSTRTIAIARVPNGNPSILQITEADTATLIDTDHKSRWQRANEDRYISTWRRCGVTETARSMER